MKSTLTIAVMIFIFIAANTVPGELRADKLEKAYKKADNTKTWVVYDKGGHMSVGDKFRIKFQKDNSNNNEYKFKPLFKLRTKWGHNIKDYSVDLTNVDGNFLCGMAEVITQEHEKPNSIRHGESHLFVIKFPEDNLEDMEIIWSSDDIQDMPDDMNTECKNTESQNHGGRAHAEPN